MQDISKKLPGLAIVALLAAGCSAGPDAPVVGEEANFKILVAPWEVDSDAGYACYAISVRNPKGGLVWSDDSICTDTFSLGEHGVLGYVGICDAADGGINTVRLSLVNLVSKSGEQLGNWGDHPPTFEDQFLCSANEDTVVRAAFVVLTEGSKGFLDVSVRVDEIACNAKIDCRDDFLSASDTQPQGTLVVALTCDADYLFMDDLELTCLDADDAVVTVAVDPGNGPGSHPGYPEEFVFGVMTNYGVSSDGQSSYWITTIGIDPGWHDCHLSARMTASNGDFGNANDYPIIVARSVPFGFDAEGGFTCTNPLDGDGSGIVTDWDDDPDYDNCLSPDETTPDDVTDVIVEDCDDGDPDPQDECEPGTSDPDEDGVCTPDPIVCEPGTSDPDEDGVCTPDPIVCEPGTSDPDEDGVCTPDDEGCTYSHGYWKNHHACECGNPAHGTDWPVPEDESTLICGVTWLSAISANGGSTWTVLARQWIAARLNVANGASAPDEVVTAIAAAEVMLTANCAGISNANKPAANALAGTLEAYNTGVTGPGHCDDD